MAGPSHKRPGYETSAVPSLTIEEQHHALPLVALADDGEIWIIEIKSSVADFRADQKWQDYRMHCDRLLFATAAEVPHHIFPQDAGLIVADEFGADLVREPPEHRMHAATRKTMLLLFARAAARRLQVLADPHGPYAAEL